MIIKGIRDGKRIKHKNRCVPVLKHEPKNEIQSYTNVCDRKRCRKLFYRRQFLEDRTTERGIKKKTMLLGRYFLKPKKKWKRKKKKVEQTTNERKLFSSFETSTMMMMMMKKKNSNAKKQKI